VSGWNPGLIMHPMHESQGISTSESAWAWELWLVIATVIIIVINTSSIVKEAVANIPSLDIVNTVLMLRGQ
jgi:hypothetical protein